MLKKNQQTFFFFFTNKIFLSENKVRQFMQGSIFNGKEDS